MAGQIWITSDTHYNHKNIVSGTSEWKDEESLTISQRTRKFDTLEEHNKTLIDTFNKYVKEDDILYHLGDWSFGGIESIWNFRKQLKCKTIHLIYGNHDQHIESNKILPNYIIDGICLHSQSMFESVQYIKNIKLGHNKFFLSHFAHRVWDKSHHGTIMLYGHSHGTIPDYGKSMDIGVDVAFKLYEEYRPFNINEIVEIMNKRDIKLVDHHNKNTN